MIGPTDFQIILGKVRPLSRPHPEAHPQVLIIAPLGVARCRGPTSCRCLLGPWWRGCVPGSRAKRGIPVRRTPGGECVLPRCRRRLKTDPVSPGGF
ncbi:hypothetical protein CKJ70_26725 [Mycobacterium avium]|nr:hypothetical protein CKJ70_26725 [Mycobacterium avium]